MAKGSKSGGLGDWLSSVWGAVERVPQLEARVVTWVPTLFAARSATRALVELGRETLGPLTDEERAWKLPDSELAALVGAMAELADALPALDKAVPSFQEMSQLRAEVASDPATHELGISLLKSLEELAQSGLTKLVELAFFSRETPQSEATAERLTALLTRVEQAADSLLAAGIEAMAKPPTDGSADNAPCPPPSEPPSKDEDENDEGGADVDAPDVAVDPLSPEDS
ncbi:hypothetical protein DV096_15030 [Bradymonadaceae bacterium TMQ3]|uniref:Uncharacterized protein n=1 Tax=Lujinxingia sediminis TaxID=2480984 RepID=A0ABY0CVE6_9DELT|nr:hypothetical protein [Lujinxingia sediminis]RDV37290.1 hypothetical protein DV096_15030 [Bradymonadaceae bacterium TMQ3]RVU46763.1 hypothetical protein EA187_06405 [Lujinxingia sediminis]TXC74773.1 hypothetical protein FRC91_14550 [Bradymonadales bacterium TMQ1]